MDGGSQKKNRPIADAVACYGVGILGEIDHQTRCGLWLNRSRVELRRAAVIDRGVGRAMSTEPASPEWYDAIHLTEEEGKARRQLDLSQRELDRMASQMAGGM